MKTSLFQKLPNVIPTKEFKQTDAWEQRKLGDAMLEKVESVTPLRRNSYALWSVPAYTNSKPELATGDKIQSTKQRILDGDILLCKINPRINRVWVVDTGNLDTSSPIASLEWIIFRTSGKSMDRQFLVDFLSSPKFRNFLLSETIGVTGSQKRVQRNSVKEFMFHLPSLAEQSRIGELFKTLDNLIAATERKKELLQKKKQAYLQLIFSQHLRFKGFTKPWEQRKLGDVGNLYSGYAFPNSEQGGKNGILFLKVSDMNLAGNELEITKAKNYVTNKQIAIYGWKPVIDLPAIIFAKVGAAIMLNRKRICTKPFLLDNNTMAYSPNPMNLDIAYTVSYFHTIDFSSLTRIGAVPSIAGSDIAKLVAPVPCMSEQSRVGELFKTLDELIKANDRKLELLKKKKKAYLQKMFI
ncbi:restriction endonuclease S subunit [Scardovia inopinata]|uniref:Type I restriction modification DNA specificity domain-containing protein n=1 Tax=Scardovia inopinata F0304 TaxID=641146 RepID=W5IIK7_SCAIO|nr:restriction endonuclease subunit S [Scardovia inopinata]EFG26833.1 hypothetical protein HMPREF9020_00461 [Scardovia inopinata F0304]SUV51953.1 restriction endonuclease S subunit [Scardovia inopinata]